VCLDLVASKATKRGKDLKLTYVAPLLPQYWEMRSK
jgi:hypothetical protein